jgi:hypothetical protein
MEAFMRIAAVSVFGLMLATGSAWAQSSYDYRDRDSDGARGSTTYGDSNYSGDRSSRRWGGGQDDDDHHGYGKGHFSRGAAFHLKAGDREFRVRCPSDESTRECADAALMMFRQVQDAARTTTGLSPSTSGSSAAPGTSTSPGVTGGTGSATGR